MYPWKSYIMNLLNYSRKVQDTRLKCEGWERDTVGHLNAWAHDGPNVGHNIRAARFAEGQVVERWDAHLWTCSNRISSSHLASTLRSG